MNKKQLPAVADYVNYPYMYHKKVDGMTLYMTRNGLHPRKRIERHKREIHEFHFLRYIKYDDGTIVDFSKEQPVSGRLTP